MKSDSYSMFDVIFKMIVFLVLLEDTSSKNKVQVYQQLALSIILVDVMLFPSQLTLQLSFF